MRPLFARLLLAAPAAAALPALAALGATIGTGCNDATHDMQVAALGGEDPGVPQGPLHRPGQPCLVCHGGQGPASSQFSTGGTVYTNNTSTTPASGVTVTVEDINGSVGTTPSNAAGNFYIPSGTWSPTYPTLPSVTAPGSVPQAMTSHVGRDGSCAHCHSDPASPTSAGHIYVNYVAPSHGP
ncbi:MAG: hypothetical protein ACRENE_24220 [Polyangiaceae bacterium]